MFWLGTPSLFYHTRDHKISLLDHLAFVYDVYFVAQYSTINDFNLSYCPVDYTTIQREILGKSFIGLVCFYIPSSTFSSTSKHPDLLNFVISTPYYFFQVHILFVPEGERI